MNYVVFVAYLLYPLTGLLPFPQMWDREIDDFACSPLLLYLVCFCVHDLAIDMPISHGSPRGTGYPVPPSLRSPSA